MVNRLGFDRMWHSVRDPSIRDVIAFPKTAKGTCLMTSPQRKVEPKVLKELHLELKRRRKSN